MLTRLAPRPLMHRERYEGVLGTVLELQVRGVRRLGFQEIEGKVLGEIARLESIFSSFLPDSELARWQQAGSAWLSPELTELLQLAEDWIHQTQGAFNPATEALKRLYGQDPAPTQDTLEALREALQPPLWRRHSSWARLETPLPLSFNALAEGLIVDKALQAAWKAPYDLLLNLGGDLRHLGPQGVRVAVAHPFHAAENALPLARVLIKNQAMATSGLSQRGLHLLDPRTLRPAAQVVQATVVAPDTTTADVLATVFCVLNPAESLALAERMEVGCLLVESGGKTYSNLRFDQQKIA